MVGFDELHGLRNGVGKLEAELEELRQTLRVTQATSPGSHAISKIAAEIERCNAIRKGMLRELRLQESDFWSSFKNRFMELAREEQGRADVITKGETLRRMDKVLRISCNYQKHPEIWVNLEKPEERNFCLLHTPPHGLWGHYTGALSENFRERVRSCVAQAGRALPDYQEGIDPEDFWLHRLYLDLVKNNSDSLLCASNEGGMIVSVCVASATFCARLEREALQQSEPNEPARKDAIDIDRAIASWKRMHRIDGGTGLSGHGENADNKIPKDDVDLIEHEVWVDFFNAAKLSRTVEREWESVLSSKKAPDQHVDLELTFALTKEYVRAISEAVSRLADLLATAAISRHAEMTPEFRDWLWRECLDFASRLGQWDTFTIWVDRVIRIQAPLTPDGSVDRNKLEETIAKRRQFFEERISMYGQDWLGAADSAINLRLTASAPETLSAENNGKTARSAESRSTNKQYKSLTDREQKIWAVIQRGLKATPPLRGTTYCREVDAAKVSPPRKGIWKDGPRTYVAAYKSGDKRLVHWIQDEKSKIRRKAELVGLVKTRSKLASE